MQKGGVKFCVGNKVARKMYNIKFGKPQLFYLNLCASRQQKGRQYCELKCNKNSQISYSYSS
jgi:hypothetical protein